MFILNFIRGFCMALADSVPGVSGGTVAFLLGFYDDFISTLDNLVRGTMQQRKAAVIFLGKLGIGWIIGFVIAVSILANVFQTKIYEVSSLFMGFIIFAIPIVIKEEKESFVFSRSACISGLIGFILVCLITYFNPISGQGLSVDLTSLNIGLMIYVFLAAMISICAMVLPGISGSTMLLIFGLYVPIISAVKEVISFNFNYIPIIIVFMLGIATGIAGVIRIIKNALEKHRSAMIFFILGMMLASLYAIVMGPQTLEIPVPPLQLNTFSWIYFVIGGLIIYSLQMFKNYTDKKSKK